MTNLRSTVLSFMATMAQVQDTDLNTSGVKQFCKEYKPYLYMICLRPRITCNPKIETIGRNVLLTFNINREGNIEKQEYLLELPEEYSLGIPAYPYQDISLINIRGEHCIYRAGLILQCMAEKVIPDPDEVHEALYSHLIPPFDPDQYSFIRATDLKVVYIGQSFGVSGERTALDRLKNHEKLLEVYRYITHERPDFEPWIILLPFEKQKLISELSPGIDGEEADAEELLKRHQEFCGMDLKTRVCYTEAALIHYFKPIYNEKFKQKFPLKSHKSYEHLYRMPIEKAAIELQTNKTLRCRLFSDHVKPKYQHTYEQIFNNDIDRKKFISEAFSHLNSD